MYIQAYSFLHVSLYYIASCYNYLPLSVVVATLKLQVFYSKGRYSYTDHDSAVDCMGGNYV